MKIPYRMALGLAALALGFAPGAWAQGCVLCYTSLAASGPAAMKAFQFAMLALLIPALFLFLGLFWVVFRGARTTAPMPRRKAKSASSFWRWVPRPTKAAEGRV